MMEQDPSTMETRRSRTRPKSVRGSRIGLLAACGLVLLGTCSEGPGPAPAADMAAEAAPELAPDPVAFPDRGVPYHSAELYPNEPAGFIRLTERHFGARDDDGWRTGDHAEFSLAVDPTAPVSGPTVGEVRFPAGWRGGSSPTWSERSLVPAGATSLYAAFWVKVSDNWQGHPVNSKIAYFLTHGRPVVFPVYIGRDAQPLTTEVRIQDTPAGARNLQPNVGRATIRRGEWHRWELLLVNNTGDRADGQVHWWIDGVSVGAYADVRFSSSAQEKIWERISWRPVWGGAGGEVREEMYMRIDRFYASGAP